MSYESRAYDNEHGDPVVVLVVTGTHDVSRLVHLFASGQPLCEQISLGHRILRQVKHHNAGRAALRLLRDHGGADFTADEQPPVTMPTHAELVGAIADPGGYLPRGDNYRESIPSWSARAVAKLLGRSA